MQNDKMAQNVKNEYGSVLTDKNDHLFVFNIFLKNHK
jgi:hypothetical protein